MTPSAPNFGVLQRRLAHQSTLLTDLRSLQPITSPTLASQPVIRAAVERMVQALVDLAVDINSHIAVATLSKSPTSARDSFDLMVVVGVLDAEQTAELKPAVGLRNILVHMYTDIDLEILAGSVERVDVAFTAYVKSVARWILSQSSD
jgi:uncharacterized protein YutE (UPF0331/DUF86 family)